MSSQTKKNSVSTSLCVTLPSRVFTRSGSSLDPREDVWRWTDGPFNALIDFRLHVNGYQKFVPALKQCLLHFVRNYSCKYAENLDNAFAHFRVITGDCPDGAFTPTHLANYLEKLQEHEKWRLGTLNVLFQKWVEFGLLGVDPECAVDLAERRKPGNKKGEAVRTRDPVQGPFSEEEYTSLYSAVNSAYGQAGLPLWVLLLTRLLLACGGRISQYASLKIRDFDNATYVFRLPQAKNRAEHIRTSFLEFDISPQTGQLISEYLDSLQKEGYDDDSAFFPERLLLPRVSGRGNRSPDDMFYGHCSPQGLSQCFNRLIRTIAPPTSRLDYAPMPVTAKRFRYTFGTRLAEEGASKLLIANRLGHVDLQHVDVYVSASAKIVENIDRAMGAQLAPLARAFKGQLVNDEAQTTCKGASGSRIIDFRVSSAPVGSCAGKTQGCAFNKPVACYICFRFEPWVDAPHEKVLKRLKVDRENWGDDERMAAVNDEPIRAIEEVISLCAQALEQRRAATAGGGS